MCGRFTIHSDPGQVAFDFRTRNPLPNIRPRYNAAPTQDLPVVRLNPESHERSLDLLRWGLVPRWAKDAAIGNRMINARAEGVDSKPSFRDAFGRRRCLVPADAFYEWKKEGARKQPYAVARVDGRPMALAGLWEGWKDPATGAWLRTFTIVTTAANEAMAPIHDRMPVVLDEADWGRWLGEEEAEPGELLAKLRPYEGELRLWPVGRRVGNAREDDPGLIEPVRTAGAAQAT